MVKYEKYQKAKDVKRAEGDKWMYYIFHSFFTVLFFIIVAIRFEFFVVKSELVMDLFISDFFMSIVYVFIVSIALNMTARVFAYIFIQGVYRNTATKNFWILNSQGLNKIGIRYFIATFLTAIIFCTGAVIILQRSIFNTEEGEIVSLIMTYIIIKIFVFITTKLLIGARG